MKPEHRRLLMATFNGTDPVAIDTNRHLSREEEHERRNAAALKAAKKDMLLLHVEQRSHVREIISDAILSASDNDIRIIANALRNDESAELLYCMKRLVTDRFYELHMEELETGI